MHTFVVAIARGHPDIVQVLLEYGADANATFPSCGESGCNILSTAVKIYMWSPSRWSEIDTIRLEIVRLLLKHGAIDVRCGRCSRTALDFAQRSGNQRLVELLLIAMKTTSLNIAPKTGPKTQRSRDHRSPHPSQP
jgi:ankyrin repeat protein